MSLNFDLMGNLQPATAIELDIKTVELYFTDSVLRKNLFANYLRYIEDLKNILPIPCSFFQWVDGSFVSKKENPHDIDIVTFLDFRHYETITQYDFLKSPLSEKKYGLDCYFVKIFPSNHKQFFEFEADRAYWYDWFSQTNPKHHRLKKTFPKGFIQINF